MGAKWTDNQTKRLRQCAADGLSFTETAVRLNTTRNAVAGKAHREGIVFAGRQDYSASAHKAWDTKRRLARQAKA